jgi:hypothetical protein
MGKAGTGMGMGSFEGETVINIGSLLGKILDREGDVIMERKMDPCGVLATTRCKMQGGWLPNCNMSVHPLCSKYY